MADDLRAEQYERGDADYERVVRPGRRGRRLMTAMVAVAAVLGFGVVLVYAYNKGRQDAGPGTPPLITAREGPTKIRPEQPGGMQVPDQDKEVFTRMDASRQSDKPERLLPAPEKPMEKPAAPEASESAAALPNIEPASGSDGPKLPPLPKSVPEKIAVPAVEAPSLPPPPPVANVPADSAAAAEPPAARTPAAAAEKTAAVTKPAPAAKAPPPAGGYRIQLSALRSEAAVRRNWATLQKKHADLIGRLALNVERRDLGKKGIYYRMQGGPLASAQAASSLCDRLKSRKVSCIVVRP